MAYNQQGLFLYSIRFTHIYYTLSLHVLRAARASFSSKVSLGSFSFVRFQKVSDRSGIQLRDGFATLIH